LFAPFESKDKILAKPTSDKKRLFKCAYNRFR
jgi:hypothetical protein